MMEIEGWVNTTCLPKGAAATSGAHDAICSTAISKWGYYKSTIVA